jgi:hypothetical protein
MEIGRVLGGSTKRSDVARRIKELARQRVKPSEIIEEAISAYEMLDMMSHVDSRCLVIGLQLANKVLENAVTVLSNVAKLFTSEMVSHYLGAIMKGYETAKESSEQTIPHDLKQTFTQTMMPLISMVTQLLTSMLSSTVSTLTSGKVSQTITSTQQQGVKIE